MRSQLERWRSPARLWTGLGLLVLIGPLLVVAPRANAAAATSGTVYLQTQPALGGVRLHVGSVLVVTGSGGTASVRVGNINGIASTVSLASTMLNSRTTLALASVQPSGQRVSHESHLTVGLDVTSSVTIKLDAGSTGVQPSAVHQVRLHAVTGQTLLVDPARTPTVTLLSRKSRNIGGVLQSQAVTWTVDSIQTDQRLAITTSRTKFDPFANPVWEMTVSAVAGVVDVETVPAIPDATFQLDGATMTTGATGAGQLAATDLNGVTDRLRLTSPSTPTSTIAITRVTKLPPTGPFERRVLVALAVSRPVSLTFHDPHGHPVPASRISQVQLTGAGQVRTLSGREVDRPVSLLAEQAKLVNGDWQVQPVTYAVSQVSLDGANAVFSGQQRFDAAQLATWPIEVSVFDLNVSVRDVLFGRLIGSKAWVSRPDGTRVYVHWSGSGPTELHALVRGTHLVHTDAAVLGADTRVLVSRSAAVEIRVVTALDVAVALLVAAVVAGALIVVGRLVQRRRPVVTDEAEGAVHASISQ